jgi:hypothetical protein
MRKGVLPMSRKLALILASSALVSLFSFNVPGVTRFVRMGANQDTPYHAGARLVWVGLSPSVYWHLHSQRDGVGAARGSGAARRVPIRLLPWSVWPLPAVLNRPDFGAS